MHTCQKSFHLSLAKYHTAGARMHQPVMKVLLVQNNSKDESFKVHQLSLYSNTTLGNDSANQGQYFGAPLGSEEIICRQWSTRKHKALALSLRLEPRCKLLASSCQCLRIRSKFEPAGIRMHKKICQVKTGLSCTLS
jgi:hypothetical protein